jgi:hypothetical protein
MNAPLHAKFEPDDNLTESEKDIFFEIHLHTLAKYSPEKDLPQFNYANEVARIANLFNDPRNPVTVKVHPELLLKIRSLSITRLH